MYSLKQYGKISPYLEGNLVLTGRAGSQNIFLPDF